MNLFTLGKKLLEAKGFKYEGIHVGVPLWKKDDTYVYWLENESEPGRRGFYKLKPVDFELHSPVPSLLAREDEPTPHYYTTEMQIGKLGGSNIINSITEI